MTEIELTRLTNIETMQDVLLVKITLLLGAKRGIDWAHEMDDEVCDGLEAEAEALTGDHAQPTHEGAEIDALIREWRALEAEARPLRAG